MISGLISMPAVEPAVSLPSEAALRMMPREALFRISEAAHDAASLSELYGLIHGIVSELMPAQNLFIAIAAEACGRLREVNESFVRLFGYESRDELPASFWDLLDEEQDAAVPLPELLRRKRDLSGVSSLELPITRKDGETRWILASLSLVG